MVKLKALGIGGESFLGTMVLCTLMRRLSSEILWKTLLEFVTSRGCF